MTKDKIKSRRLDKKELRLFHDVINYLDEKDEAKSQIYRLIKWGGIKFVEVLVHDAIEIEATGGLMIGDKSRRRTLGGVFFYLARRRVPKSHIQKIFYWQDLKTKQAIEDADNG